MDLAADSVFYPGGRVCFLPADRRRYAQEQNVPHKRAGRSYP